MNNTKARCPKCGGTIPAEATQGLCPQCALGAIANPTEADPPRADHPPPPSLQTVARAFPHLEIVELIGAGGMGAVYKARQPKLERLVALKLLTQPPGAPGVFAERFGREARLLARLNHPGIVSVYDYGEAGGFFYLLMEYVDGVNLRQAMRAGRFTPALALALVPKICEALQFAHDEGILHRDIKPENILLDTRGRVKIADFGIAKLMGPKASHATLTASGLAVGTPNYMAPEQLEHPEDLDQRADIYSLGVVFYELLTGELPLGRFLPPSQKTPMDPRVDDVVLRALERERERRQQNATEVKTAVEQITSAPAQPETVPPPVRPASAPKTSMCYVSTSNYLRTFRGRFLYIYQAKGELRLDAETLRFSSGWQTVTIPLTSIRTLSEGDYPTGAKPAPLSYIGITFDDLGSSRTLLFTPAESGLMLPWETNLIVAEWLSALQEAIRAATGRPISVDRSNVLQNWPWGELAKTFLLTAASCTAAFALMPLLLERRLPNSLSELVWGPVTAAITLAALLAVRWWRLRAQAMPAPSVARPLRAWERAWLRLPASFRRGARTFLAGAALALMVFFGSCSSSGGHEPGQTIQEWRIGAFQPWLRVWHDPGTPRSPGGFALNPATISFACGIAAAVMGLLSLRLFQGESASFSSGNAPPRNQSPKQT